MQSCKIKVRPQSCRSCPLWRPCNLQDMMGIDTIFRQNMKMAMKWKSSVYNLPYMMGIDAIFRQNMKMALKSWLKIGIGPRELAVKNYMYLYNEHAWKKMSVRKKLKYVHCKYVYWPLSLFNPINWRIHFIRLSTTWTHVLRMLSRSGVKLITFLLQGRTLPMAIPVVEFQVMGIQNLTKFHE